MPQTRPDPDKLLNAIHDDRSAKGHLRIYFGYAAGVGKSFTMLKGAHDLKRQGQDVVIGYLEAHGRPETENLMQGLEVIPPQTILLAGATFKEFDLDATIKRRPQVVLVDEMAHTNAASCRHTKRWQDIEELLRAGINVHTTLNVQHLSGLNDIVAQITGVAVRETLPDVVFDRADEVTLVDIPPDELLKRFKAGKVYRGPQTERALENYFKKSNLVALREIALRRTAERVHADVNQERLTANIQGVVPTQERLGCLLDTDEATMSALRATARLAALMQCPWGALNVESARQTTRLPTEEKRLQKNLKLARELGGTITRRNGAFGVLEVVRWAREESITKLVMARPRSHHLLHWIERLAVFFIGWDIDIVWIHPISPDDKNTKSKKIPEEAKNFLIRPYVETTGIVFITFVIAALMGALKAPEANLTLVYLLGVVVAAVIHGEGASAWAAFLSALILSFGLTNFSFRLSWFNAQYLINFGLSLGMGLLASQMTSRLKNQAERARRDREQTEALYRFSSILSGSSGLHQIVATAQTMLQSTFGGTIETLLPDETGTYRPLIKGKSVFDPAEAAVADWVARHAESAGMGTQTLPQSTALYLPLKGSEGVVGVLSVKHKEIAGLPRELLDRFVQSLGAKIESTLVAERAEKLYWQAERERLRGDLLSSVSQGFKTPLDILTATSGSLLDKENEKLSLDEKREMLTLIFDESLRLKKLVDNLTQLTGFEQQKLPVHRQALELNEFVQAEAFKLKHSDTTRTIALKLSSSPISVEIDPLLFAQVIFNIVDNAREYTPHGTAITLSTTREGNTARILIEDEGDGLPEEQLEKVFEKYYRLSSRSRGAGLGLTVCRAIVEAHNAHLWAENRRPKGLRLVIELPTL